MTVTTLVLGMVPLGHAQDAADAPQQPPAAPAAAEPAPSIAPAPDAELAAEVQQLRADVDQMKDQLARLNSMLEQMQSQHTTPEKAPAPTKAKGKPSATAKKTATASPAATIPPVAAADETTPLTVLVFHDGHRTEARNYAIVGQTLWIYTQDDSRKVPLADLDVAATKNANSDRGIIFQVPNTK